MRPRSKHVLWSGPSTKRRSRHLIFKMSSSIRSHRWYLLMAFLTHWNKSKVQYIILCIAAKISLMSEKLLEHSDVLKKSELSKIIKLNLSVRHVKRKTERSKIFCRKYIYIFSDLLILSFIFINYLQTML